MYSKKLANCSNQLKTKNVSSKIGNFGNLNSKSEVLSMNKFVTHTNSGDSAYLNLKATQNIDKSTQNVSPTRSQESRQQTSSMPDQQSIKDTQISSEPSIEQLNAIKKSKLSSTDFDGIKEIFLKAVEEIKKKDQEVTQEIEREITKVLKIVTVSDDDEILALLQQRVEEPSSYMR